MPPKPFCDSKGLRFIDLRCDDEPWIKSKIYSGCFERAGTWVRTLNGQPLPSPEIVELRFRLFAAEKTIHDLAGTIRLLRGKKSLSKHSAIASVADRPTYRPSGKTSPANGSHERRKPI